jgi:hypothetical protein
MLAHSRREPSASRATVRQVPGQTDIPVKILVGGEPVRSRTRATTVGPHVLVLDTVLPDNGTELHSIYTGHEGTSTLASHLLLAPGLRDTIAAEHDHDSIPVTHARRRCLYDHLQHLQDLLHDTGADANIPLDETALAAIER